MEKPSIQVWESLVLNWHLRLEYQHEAIAPWVSILSTPPRDPAHTQMAEVSAASQTQGIPAVPLHTDSLYQCQGHQEHQELAARTLGGIALCLRKDKRGKKRERKRKKKARNRERGELIKKKTEEVKKYNRNMGREGWKKEKYLPKLQCLIHNFLMRIVTAYIFQYFIII